MVEKGIDVLCLQETRFKFSDDTCEDGVLYRKVENLGCTFRICLQSAIYAPAVSDRGYSYNGTGIVSRRVLSRVRKVSDRIMSAGYHLNDGKGTLLNVYAPIRDSSEADHAQYSRHIRNTRSKRLTRGRYTWFCFIFLQCI